MENPAQVDDNAVILITDVSSYLGEALAKNFLKHNFSVYGAGHKNPSEEILSNSHFTLLDIDLAQPFPGHLPVFDLIIHLAPEKQEELANVKVSAASKNIINFAKQGICKVVYALPISASSDYLDYLSPQETSQQFLNFFLVGHVYGPQMKLESKFHSKKETSFFESNDLVDLISQSAISDRIILENEGLTVIYPTYIDDAVDAFNKFIFTKNPKPIRFIISDHPLTALSTAYKIQNAIRLASGKELNLFFAGEENSPKPKPEPVVKIHELAFKPNFTLTEGLEKTIKYLSQENQIYRNNQVFAPEDKPTIEVENKFQETKIAKKKRLNLPKFSSGPLNARASTAVLVIAILFLVFVLKTGGDIFLGTKSIKSAKSQLEAGDLARARQSAQSAQGSFTASSSEFKFITYPLRVLFAKKLDSINNALSATAAGASAVVDFIDGAQSLSQNLSTIVSGNSKSPLDLASAQASLNRSYFESASAASLAKDAQNGHIFATNFKSLEDSLTTLANVSLSAQEISTIIPNLVGADSTKNYLLLVQNNTELRPGGGFIGNYAQIAFEGGKLKDIKVDDIYNIDGQLKEKISPPQQLIDKLGVDKLYLRDSNWTTDFRINAQTARDFYKKETGQTIDGVIAIDLSFFEKLLEKMGPIKLENYSEEINAGNLFDKGEYYSEVGFFPGSTQKRDFFGSLAKAVIGKIEESLKQKTVGKNSPYLALVSAASDSLAQKHIMMAFDDAEVGSFVRLKGWDNELPPFTYNPADNAQSANDFLALSEANVGANKVNRYIERAVNYDMTVDRDAGLVATINITYKNNSPADTWPAGTYVNYLRVYVPLNSSLESYQVDGQNIDLNPTLTAKQKKPSTTAQSSTQGNLTVFDTIVEVPVKQTKNITFKYRIPKNIKLESAPAYNLYVAKQPGTNNDALKFSFNLPAYLKIDSINGSKADTGKQNYSNLTNLETDKIWEIKVTKK